MSEKVKFGAMLDGIDEELKRLREVMRSSPPGDRRAKALDAFNRMSALRFELLEVRGNQLANAFGQVEVLLRQEAATLAANPFKDALDRVAALAGVALSAAGSDGTMTEIAGSFEPLKQLVESLIGGTIGTVAESVERPAPATRPAAVRRSQPSGEQGRLLAAIRSNATKHGVNAGLLGAVAFVESGFRNVSSQSSSARGPFQFIPSTWNGLVKLFGDETGITRADITKVEAQAEMAALTFKGYAGALKGIRSTPSNAELYFCHFLGTPAARACLKGDVARPIDETLRAFYRGTSLGEGFATRVMDSNRQLTTDGRARTVEEVLGYYRARLLDGETRFQHLASLEAGTDEAPAARPAAASPPSAARDVLGWVEIALGEKAKNVTERPGGEHDPEILKYLASTTIGSDPRFLRDETPWCSAFVNWCVTQSGLTGTDSAKARSWHDGGWGRQIDTPAKGCIVVLWREAPDHPDRLGHVGFLDRVEDDTLFLLGGNQGNTINVTPYPRSRLLSFRLPA